MQHSPARKRVTPFWRDERFLQALGQAIFLLAILSFGMLIINNMRTGLQKQGMTLGFSFLSGIAGFDIAELPIVYSRTSSYLQAYTVGLLNTLLVSGIGIIFSTILGVILGVARLSKNFLVNRLAALYLELMRNMSLLVFLIFWYQGLFLKLPRIKDAIVWFDSIYWTNRGIGVPWGIPTASYPTFQLILLSGIFLALIIYFSLQAYANRTGRAPLSLLWSTLAFVIVAALGWLIMPVKPLEISIPFAKGLNLSGGKIFTPEFMALTSGLVLYTAAFIGEVVRSGILAVSHGQVEAARALGLNGFQTLRLVVFPQALRVIVPPLTSQYLNLTKNSSLAVAIGYPDMFYVSSTIINQSGRAVEMIAMVMLTYLTFSLVTSLFMNWYNAKIKLVER
ncbi:MAG: ABC transporter permease subunit [Anaerolineales bacterium]|nr:ABC transporter permease subunit [Anaerolineales bacterium]